MNNEQKRSREFCNSHERLGRVMGIYYQHPDFECAPNHGRVLLGNGPDRFAITTALLTGSLPPPRSLKRQVSGGPEAPKNKAGAG